MRYQVIMSNLKTGICVREDELEKVILGINTKSVIIVREGVINPSFLVAIIPDYERAKIVGQGIEEPSPFAKLISGKMGMLSAPERSKAQEEGSRDERKLKRGQHYAKK